MTTETPPRPRRRTQPDPSLPRLSALGWVRWAWRQLTSMRTALFLLLLLSVAAVPGSIFPQRNIDCRSRRRLHRAEPHDLALARPPRLLRRLRLAVVLGDLPAALRLPRRLHRAPHQGARRRAAGDAAASALPPHPARRARRGRHRPLSGGGARRRARGAAGQALPPALPRRHQPLGRVGLPARDRQPPLPPRAHGHHRRHGRRSRLRVARGRHPARGRPVRLVGRHLQHDLSRPVGRHREPAALRAGARPARRAVQRDPRPRLRHTPRVHRLHDAPARARRTCDRRDDLGQPPDHRRRRRHLPARQRLHARHHRARRRRRDPLPRGHPLPAAGRQLPLGRRHQGALGVAEAARPHRLLPADRRADLRARPRVALPRRQGPRAGPVDLGGQPLPRRRTAVRLHAQHRRDDAGRQGGRLAGPHPAQARPDLRDPGRPRHGDLRLGQALRGPVGAHRPGGADQPRQCDPRHARPHPRPHDQASSRLRPRPHRPAGGHGGRSPSGDGERPATVVTIGGLSKDSDAGLAAIVAAVHDRLAERNDRS